MKKTNPRQISVQLWVGRETLRRLSQTDLHGVKGGESGGLCADVDFEIARIPKVTGA